MVPAKRLRQLHRKITHLFYICPLFRCLFRGSRRQFRPFYFSFSRNYFFLSACNFLRSYKKKFVTKFVTLVTKFLTHVTKFVIHVTKFVTKNILYERKKYQGEKKNYQQGKKNFQGERRGRLQRGCRCCAVNLQAERTIRIFER